MTGRPRRPVPARAAPRADRVHSTTSRDGTTIAYDRVDDGDPLVLVPGAFSYRRYPGQVRLAGLLAARFTVYSYDRRGRGDSGDSKPYAVEREIEDLAAVIDAYLTRLFRQMKSRV